MRIKDTVRISVAVGLLLTACVGLAAGDASNVTGPIQVVTDTSVMVRGITFTLTGETEYEKGTKADLAVGVMVKVKGDKDNGALVAKKITFLKGGGEGSKNVNAEGKITALSESEITVADITFAITASTKIVRGTFSDLAVDVKVEIKGRKQDDGTIEANIIKIAKDDIKLGPRKKAKGVITSLARDGDGQVTQLTLDDETVLDVPEGLDLQGRNGLAATANDLAEGLRLRVLYTPYKTPADSGAVGQALKLSILGRENIKGEIESESEPDIDLPSIIVNSELIYYDDVTIVIGARKGVDDPGDLEPGTPVSVLCNPLAGGAFLANKVAVTSSSGGEGKPIRDRGIVYGVVRNGGMITSFNIGEQTYLVDENTEFKVAGYDGPFPTEDFESGLEVVVKALKNANGDLVAIWVRVILPIYKYCGEIEAISENSLIMFGLEILVTAWTEFEDFGVDNITLADLAVGERVKIKVVLFPDGTLVASEIEPCDDDLDRIRGEIESVEETLKGVSLVVSGIPINVTPATEIKSKKADLTLYELAVGMTVDVWGTFDMFGELQAVKIKVR